MLWHLWSVDPKGFYSAASHTLPPEQPSLNSSYFYICFLCRHWGFGPLTLNQSHNPSAVYRTKPLVLYITPRLPFSGSWKSYVTRVSVIYQINVRDGTTQSCYQMDSILTKHTCNHTFLWEENGRKNIKKQCFANICKDKEQEDRTPRGQKASSNLLFCSAWQKGMFIHSSEFYF